ncbi:MAG: glutathione S-transferase family protein [Alphaproteobacteria bacterium]|nr:glutathione S-transferase family protein [Alphaproteobacteria bacterium]MDE2111751.1 glutathione S-transferase family protein [Alphaproteobacteria bacterium]MDE2494916.1 glutathione S-transferase family protein [Alphaproteobacteria bacterium]
MSEIEIIGAPQSTFVRTLRMAMEEKGVSYKLTPARPHTPEVDAIHPFGKVPVMRHGDFTLCESKAIASYIDKAFPGPHLFPDDARLCGQIEQWISLINTAIQPSIIPYLRGYFFSQQPDGKPDHQMIEAALPNVQANIALLDRAVAKTGHLAGNGFTYADMLALPILDYLKVCPESRDAIGMAKYLSTYFAIQAQRPSFINTTPPPFSELRR